MFEKSDEESSSPEYGYCLSFQASENITFCFYFFFLLSFLFILKEFILIRVKKKMSLNATFMFVHLGEYGYKWPSAESERCSINQAIYKIEDFLGWKWPFNFWMMNTFSSMDTYVMSYFSLTAAVKICGCSLRE